MFNAGPIEKEEKKKKSFLPSELRLPPVRQTPDLCVPRTSQV